MAGLVSVWEFCSGGVRVIPGGVWDLVVSVVTCLVSEETPLRKPLGEVLDVVASFGCGGWFRLWWLGAFLVVYGDLAIG